MLTWQCHHITLICWCTMSHGIDMLMWICHVVYQERHRVSHSLSTPTHVLSLIFLKILCTCWGSMPSTLSHFIYYILFLFLFFSSFFIFFFFLSPLTFSFKDRSLIIKLHPQVFVDNHWSRSWHGMFGDRRFSIDDRQSTTTSCD